MTYLEAIKQAKNSLNKANIYEGFALNYLFELCELRDINLYMEMNEAIDSELLKVYQAGISRLTMDEPLAHVLGFEWFYGRRFKVSDEVLIPRQETEELIANTIMDIDELFGEKEIVVADVGTGSGNIAITIDLEIENAKVYGTDISPDALKVAKENNELLEANVVWLQGDMGQPLIKQQLMVDVLLCNPPYILEDEKVQSSVLNYEPHTALFGGQDGLKFYRQILDEAKDLLKPTSMMAFEMGYTQRDSLEKEIRSRYPQARITFKKDLAGKDRMCFVYLKAVD